MSDESLVNPHESELRTFALGFPESWEDFPWGERAIKVRKKVFLFMSKDKDYLSMSLKIPESSHIALSHDWANPTGYGLGKSGWVSMRFEPDVEVPLALIRAWIEESYRNVAPQKLIKLIAP